MAGYAVSQKGDQLSKLISKCTWHEENKGHGDFESS